MIFLSHIWQRGRREEGKRKVAVKVNVGTPEKENSTSLLRPSGGMGGRGEAEHGGTRTWVTL